MAKPTFWENVLRKKPPFEALLPIKAIAVLESADEIANGKSAISGATLKPRHCARLNIGKTTELLQKKQPKIYVDESQHRPFNLLLLECIASTFAYLQDPLHNSLTHAATDKFGVTRAALIEKFPDFISIDQYLEKHDHLPSIDELVDQGIAAVLTDAFLFEENDLHNDNYGFITDPETQKLMLARIDRDQSLWWISCGFATPNPSAAPEQAATSKPPVTATAIDTSDIATFPNLKKTAPQNWPTHQIPEGCDESEASRRKIIAETIAALHEHPKFIEKKYYRLTKFIVLFQQEPLIKTILAHFFADETNQDAQAILKGLMVTAGKIRAALEIDPTYKDIHRKNIGKWSANIATELETAATKLNHIVKLLRFKPAILQALASFNIDRVDVEELPEEEKKQRRSTSAALLGKFSKAREASPAIKRAAQRASLPPDISDRVTEFKLLCKDLLALETEGHSQEHAVTDSIQQLIAVCEELNLEQIALLFTVIKKSLQEESNQGKFEQTREVFSDAWFSYLTKGVSTFHKVRIPNAVTCRARASSLREAAKRDSGESSPANPPPGTTDGSSEALDTPNPSTTATTPRPRSA